MGVKGVLLLGSLWQIPIIKIVLWMRVCPIIRWLIWGSRLGRLVQIGGWRREVRKELVEGRRRMGRLVVVGMDSQI